VNGITHDLDWTANSGTYTVNPDCTGKLVLNTPNSPVALNIFFVIVKHGTQFYSNLGAARALSSTMDQNRGIAAIRPIVSARNQATAKMG
jgi:hypothetical protein